ncbi:MAG: Hsp20/alpha crystallin family protein [Candidatus Pacebacteria bacterium]|nr:Hsp20/alpha crystallin family protein [Candidatus Paceibacterota bacterium]
MDKNSKEYFENLIGGKNNSAFPESLEEKEKILNVENVDTEISSPENLPIATIAKSEKISLSKPKTKKIKMEKEEINDDEDNEEKDKDDEFLDSDPFFGEAEGQLTIDVFQNPEEIIIQSTVAGVSPEDLNIDITSESVSIKGKRERKEKIKEDNFFYQECYWGKFSRSIILPEEINPDKSEAELKDGILTIKLPKLNRDKSKRVKIKLS